MIKKYAFINVIENLKTIESYMQLLTQNIYSFFFVYWLVSRPRIYLDVWWIFTSTSWNHVSFYGTEYNTNKTQEGYQNIYENKLVDCCYLCFCNSPIFGNDPNIKINQQSWSALLWFLVLICLMILIAFKLTKHGNKEK